MSNIYDLIIIGGGPAGYTAALYGARAGLDVLVLERLSVGGQMASTGEIENYPGFDEGIDGYTLGEKMKSGAERFGAESEYGNVISVELNGRIKKVLTDSGEYLARAVILANGAEPRRLGAEGEEALIGQGVHYCAHCDGRFYKDSVVAVVGGGNSALEDAIYLSRLAKKVYLINRRRELRADRIYRERLAELSNVEFIPDAVVGSLREGDGGITAELSVNGAPRELFVNGIFVSIGRVPTTDIYRGSLQLDNDGYIIAEEDTKTGIPGVFAAGDIRSKPLRQIVTAASDGAVAAHFAEKYISEAEI